MKSFKHYKNWAIILSVCMMVLGIGMMIRPDISALAVCYLMGTICIATGVYELIRYYKLGIMGILFRHDLIISLLSISSGVILLCHPWGALTILPIILGIYMIIAGVFTIQISSDSYRFGVHGWKKSFVFGIVGITLGLLTIINPFAGAKALMSFIGAALIITGIENIYLFRCITRVFMSDEHKKIIDVIWHEVE